MEFTLFIERRDHALDQGLVDIVSTPPPKVSPARGEEERTRQQMPAPQPVLGFIVGPSCRRQRAFLGHRGALGGQARSIRAFATTRESARWVAVGLTGKREPGHMTLGPTPTSAAATARSKLLSRPDAAGQQVR